MKKKITVFLKNSWKPIGSLLATIATITVLSACGNSGSLKSFGNVNNFNHVPISKLNADPNSSKGKVVFNNEKFIDNWNVMTSSGNTIDAVNVLSILTPSVNIMMPDGVTFELNKNLMNSVKVVSTDPFTVQYAINPNAVWSDGTPITVEDFRYFWDMNNGKTDADVVTTSGYDSITSIDSTDNGKTATVHFKAPYPDWQLLFNGLYPAHYMKALGGDSKDPAAGWNKLTQTPQMVSGGPYMIKNYSKDGSYVQLVPNPKWYGSNKPLLKEVAFRTIVDPNQALIALKNNEIQGVTLQPEIDIYNNITSMKGLKTEIAPGQTIEQIDINLKNPFLADPSVRKAIFTAINREELLNKGDRRVNKDEDVVNTISYPKPSQYYQDSLEKYGYGKGNVQKSLNILKDAGYTMNNNVLTKNGQPVPKINIRYTNGNVIRQMVCDLIRVQLQKIGITVDVEPTDSLGKTLSHASPQYDFDMIIYGVSYNPAVVTGFAQLYATGSDGNATYYSNKEVDALIDKAESQPGEKEASPYIHNAEDIIMNDAFVLPLYIKSQMTAYRDYLGNIRYNIPFTYNIEEWGVKKE